MIPSTKQGVPNDSGIPLTRPPGGGGGVTYRPVHGYDKGVQALYQLIADDIQRWNDDRDEVYYLSSPHLYELYVEAMRAG